MSLKDLRDMELNNSSIGIRLRGFGILKQLIKEDVIKIKKDSSLIELIQIMSEQYGSEFSKVMIDPQANEISSAVCVMVNGKIVTNLKESVENGDEITFFISASGG